MQQDVQRYLKARASRVYSFDRKVYDRAVSRVAPMGIGLGLSPILKAPNSGVVPVNFASLFPGAFQSVQTDLGLTYGGTPLATTGNTSTTVLSLTGALPTTPVPVWVTATNTSTIGAGAQFNIYTDGTGTTPIMTGVTPSVGVPVALTGAAAGLSVAWAAGTSVGADNWRTTCSALADQSGNGKHYSQATASKQPVITVGFNGKSWLLFDGIDDFLRSTVNTLLSALPYQVVVVGRFAGPVLTQALIGTDGFVGPSIYGNGANTLQAYNGTAGNTIGAFSSTAPTRFSAVFTGSTSDVFLAGASSRTSVNSGAAIPSVTASVVDIGRFTALGYYGAIEIGAVIICPPTGLTAFEAAINSSGGYGPGSIAV